MNNVFPGQIYKHKHGGTYKVLYIAKSPKTLELLVVYQSQEYRDVWVRPLDNFLEPGRFTLLVDIVGCTDENMRLDSGHYAFEVCSTFKPQYTGSTYCDCGYIKDLHE